jgi:hypothetical protein
MWKKRMLVGGRRRIGTLGLGNVHNVVWLFNGAEQHQIIVVGN